MMEKKVYKARRGAPFAQKKAQIYGECIEEINDKKGGAVRTRDVIEAAQDKHSLLHSYFEWDNEIAGAKYRIHQARQLLNHLTVIVKTDGEEREQKAYLNVSVITEEGSVEQIYVTIDRALTDDEFRAQILAQAIREIEYWQQKYEEYSELSTIFQAIEAAKEEIKIEESVMNQQREEWKVRVGTFKDAHQG